MQDLIERLEKATGPDRDLDIAIWASFADPKKYRRVDTKPRYSDWDSFHSGNWEPFYPSLNAKEYTASIDAALTLVPEGWRTNWAGQVPMGKQWFWELTAMNENRSTERVWAPSAPLAICIAALKARA